MKILSLFLLLSSPAFASSDFAGHWQGTGLLGGTGFTREIDTKASLDVEERDGHFLVTECWQPMDLGLKGECISTDYEVTESDQLFHNGRRVGDIFPNRVVILEANSQVAEQMVFQRTGENGMQFDYSYVNNDGAAEHRKAWMKR